MPQTLSQTSDSLASPLLISTDGRHIDPATLLTPEVFGLTPCTRAEFAEQICRFDSSPAGVSSGTIPLVGLQVIQWFTSGVNGKVVIAQAIYIPGCKNAGQRRNTGATASYYILELGA